VSSAPSSRERRGGDLATTTSRRRRVVLAPPPAATNPDAWLAEVDADGRVPAGATREPRRIVVFVEPSPFSHVSGMKNRFLRLIENLTELGDDVVVITPDRNPPKEYAGAEVIGVHGFALPFYPGNTLLLSYARDPKVEELFRCVLYKRVSPVRRFQHLIASPFN
jgi:sulfoquinovosyltransferase